MKKRPDPFVLSVHGGFDGAQFIGEGEDAKKVYNAWMGIKPHREGLMSKEYREIGIGKAGKYWVIKFEETKE